MIRQRISRVSYKKKTVENDAEMWKLEWERGEPKSANFSKKKRRQGKKFYIQLTSKMTLQRKKKILDKHSTKNSNTRKVREDWKKWVKIRSKKRVKKDTLKKGVENATRKTWRKETLKKAKMQQQEK
jgi:hypothetical protein